MSHLSILDPEEEEKLDSDELSKILIKRVLLAQKSKVSVNDQYKIDYQSMLNDAKEGRLTFPVSRSELDHRASVFSLRRSQMGNATRELGKGVMSSVASVASIAQAGMQGAANAAQAGMQGAANVAQAGIQGASLVIPSGRTLPAATSTTSAAMPSVKEESGELGVAEEGLEVPVETVREQDDGF